MRSLDSELGMRNVKTVFPIIQDPLSLLCHVLFNNTLILDPKLSFVKAQPCCLYWAYLSQYLSLIICMYHNILEHNRILSEFIFSKFLHSSSSCQCIWICKISLMNPLLPSLLNNLVLFDSLWPCLHEATYP